VKRIFSAYWRSECNICGSAWLLLGVFLFAGCSAGKQPLSSSVADMKQLFGLSQFYVKSSTTLRAKPDSASRALGRISANTKVTEMTKNELGWSQVKTAEGKREGWVPTSSLSARPVVKAAAKARAKEKAVQSSSVKKEQAPASAPSQESTSPAHTSEVQTPAPEHEQSGGGLLSPSPAVAAPIPSASSPPPEPPAERKASPDMFDSF